MVSQSKQIFHCFGCGAGGDIFGFVMKYENLNFQEALKMLAKKAGVQLSGYRVEDGLTERKERLYVIQKEALNAFAGNLKKSKTALAYLDKRGVSHEMVEAFSLGYADRGRKVLYDHLKAKGFDDLLITQSGLIFTGESGLHDIFKNRIMFPIFNIQEMLSLLAAGLLTTQCRNISTLLRLYCLKRARPFTVLMLQRMRYGKRLCHDN